MEERGQYRPEIDGLRAVAVVGVILFHAGFGFPGGFTGVDVFFVISGFLITGLLVRDLQHGRFSFATFWERRARRIIPALVVVTLGALALGWPFLLPDDLRELGEASAVQAVFGANIYYWRSLGYFATAADQRPLLHTWSLAVEEQFYLIIPVLLWAMFRSQMLRTRKALVVVLGAGCATSLALSIYGVPRSPVATFYLLPTRAWELLLGALIVFLPRQPFWFRGPVRDGLAVTGATLIALPFFAYGPQTPFPGAAAIPSCLGTALLIWANGREQGEAPTLMGRLLSLRGVVFIGLISYSLYLWHWPFLAISKYLALEPRGSLHRASLLGLSVVAAVLSWRYVETPFRTKRWAASQRSMYACAATGLAVVILAGLTFVWQNGFPQRLSPRALAFAEGKRDMDFIHELTIHDVARGALVPIGTTRATRKPTVLVWGDSHAMAALPAVDSLLKEKGISGLAATRTLNPPVLEFRPQAPNLTARARSLPRGLSRSTLDFNEAVHSYIQKEQIPHVVLVAVWGSYVTRRDDRTDVLSRALLATTIRLRSEGIQVWLLLDVPYQPFSVPEALARSTHLNRDIGSLRARPGPGAAFAGISPEIIAEIRRTGAHVLDPKPSFLDESGQYYVVEKDGIPLYRDTAHLSARGARMILLPFLRKSLTLGDHSTMPGPS